MRKRPCYDYIVVGAGSAGCVLANRLTEDRDTQVLLVEAGPPDRHPLIHVPLGVGKLYEHELFDWGLRSEPEPGLGNRSVKLPRGKVLGGSSSVNMMAFTRGHRGDYDRWARSGARGWSFAEVLPYFKRSERWEYGEGEFRGGRGPIGVQYGKFEDPLNEAWREAGRRSGFPHSEDYNGAQAEGFGRGQYSIHNGRRSSAAVAYLRPALRRPNLHLVTGALASRVVMDGGRAIGMEYRHRGTNVRATASREVILSAGTFNTPQLLMLSGIGPASHLKEMGIHTLVDLPVGKNLQEHLAVRFYWARKGTGPFHGHMRFDRMSLSMLRAYLFGTGPATTHPSALHAFVRTDPQLEVPDIEFIFRHAPPNPHLWFPLLRRGYADGYGIAPALLHPKSRGEVLLRSAKPGDPVRIAFRFFSDPGDLPVLRAGCELARELGNAKPLDPFRGPEILPGPGVGTASEIDEWIRNSAFLVAHPAGTCAMGSGAGAVVGPELGVLGVERLRVVDASAMPDLVSAHINACVLMMAEKASDMIRNRPATAGNPAAASSYRMR